MTIALVTDSNAQLTPDLIARHEVSVVPIHVLVDGVDHREGVDLGIDVFYERLAAGAVVTTSQPAPGEFAAVYEGLAAADAIVSIHVGSELSGTLNSARVAAGGVAADIRLVDTGQTSFSVAACVLSAAAARRNGGDVDALVAAAEATAASLRNVFVMDGIDLGRAAARGSVPDLPADGTAVLAIAGTELEVLGHATSPSAAVDLMAARIEADRGPLRVAIGAGDRRVLVLADALDERLGDHAGVVETLRYRCGPSVGAFSGPGVAGAVWWPA